MNSIIRLFPSFILMMIGSGCAIQPEGVQSAPAAPPRASSAANQSDLREGMSPDEVSQIWGRPESTSKITTDKGEGDVWVYRTSRIRRTREVQTGTQMTQTVDPGTGAPQMTQEPVFGVATVTEVELTKLLFFESRLVTWTRSVEEIENAP